MYTANKSLKKQLLIILVGVVVAVLISINMTKAEGIGTTDKIASLVESNSKQSDQSLNASELIVVYDQSYNEVFKIEVDESSKQSNIHLSRFLELCDFVMEINDTFIYLFNK
ncbi:MAG: hypothetical protein AAGC88_10375 [Bacteroidota bacterium]